MACNPDESRELKQLVEQRSIPVIHEVVDGRRKVVIRVLMTITFNVLQQDDDLDGASD